MTDIHLDCHCHRQTEMAELGEVEEVRLKSDSYYIDVWTRSHGNVKPWTAEAVVGPALWWLEACGESQTFDAR